MNFDEISRFFKTKAHSWLSVLHKGGPKVTDEEEIVSKFLIPSIEITGAATGEVIGGGLGFLTSGSSGWIVGSVGGAAFGAGIVYVGKELLTRYLGKREAARIGSVIWFADKRIQKNRQEGKDFRRDGFLDRNVSNWSSAQELVEAVLLAAQREPEELKLQYFGNFLGNIAFHPEIDKSQAHFLLRLAKDLSYPQLCLLAIFKIKESYHFSEIKLPDVYNKLSPNDFSICQELEELMNLNLISSSHFMGQRIPVPTKMNVSRLGDVLYSLMNLDEMPLTEINPFASLFERLDQYT